VLCGLGRVGWRILECLRSAGVAVVAIDKAVDPADPRLAGIRFICGDCRKDEVLTQAGVASARGVIVATSDDLGNISCALMVRRLAPRVRIVLRMFNQNLVTRLGKAVPNVTALSVSALAAPLLAMTAVMGGVLAAFTVGDERRQVAEIDIASDSKLLGRPVAGFDEHHRYLVIAHKLNAQDSRILHDVDPHATMNVGDRLYVAGAPNDIRRLLEPGWDNLSGVLWAGRLRRFSRVAYRTFAEIETLVKVCTIAFLIVILGAAATYHFGLGHSWAEGLYRAINVIFTGSELGGTEYEGWGKVFVSLLKMFGTITVAAFTAIFTNYLLRARLGGAFEGRRIPDGGHVLVIGLGNVGFRVVEELDRMGERAVVVERKTDNSFVPSCRRKGVPVLIGDATLPETLKQARAKQARAVIACTSSDLVNLEVALVVAELNDKQRVVVRLGDTVLADTARMTAGVSLALSLPALAAPAFVAGLFGDRVLSIFLVGGQMLAVVEVTVQADDTALIGRSLRALAIDYHLVPVAVAGADGKIRDVDSSYRLTAGDRLTGVAAIADMEHISQRAAIPTNCAVEVVSFPSWARETLALQVRTLRQIDAAGAEAIMATTPFVLAERQTHGQAEELIAVLQREKIEGRIVPTGEAI
jgi:Trk K+ transport system NAD-binding subunit